MKKVNKHTRAGENGKSIVCPKCKLASTVYHFAWSAITCNHCQSDVNKNDWLLNEKEEDEKV